MRNRLIAALVFALPASALAASPALAEKHHRTRVLVCKDVRKSANKGTVVGAVAGGVLGNVVAGHGNKTEGTLIGAGVGAVAGHQVAKHNARKNRQCHYEYRYR
jgi:outer membrane lipoprotein SlyB